MNWNDLPVALAILRTGSLAGAARLLGRNHSTVFRRLNALEAALGARLFERLPAGYVPTEAGRRLLADAERAADAVDALQRKAQGLDRKLRGDVRVTTAPDLASAHFPRILTQLRARHPGIRVELVASDSDYDLSRREADLALRATREPPLHLVGRRISAITWHVVGAPPLVDALGPSCEVEGLLEQPWIGADERLRRLPAFAWLHGVVARDRFVAAANSVGMMASLAAGGLGLAILPSAVPYPSLQPVTRVPVEEGGALWLLTHPDLRDVARVRAVSEVIVDCLAATEEPPPSGDAIP